MKHESPLLVALRVRPMNHVEYKEGAKVTARTVDSNLVVILDPTADPDDILRANRSREKHYIFDYAFDQMATQDEVYEATMKKFVCDVLSGFNVTVFAYGPTGAGKTYTMLGTPKNPGIMVLTLNDLFFQMKATESDVIYNVTMSYMEIYNEMIRDLLDPKNGILDLREDVNGEPVVTGLSEIEATSTIQVMDLLNKGNLCRTCEPTSANKTSSRSHAILKVVVRSKSRVMDVSQDVHTGCLFMVDLAGSERASVTKNRGKRMVEGAHINRSLLALGNVINALAAGHDKVSYVNFRDSKLTRILKESLGGNAKTVMIAHISPASTSFEESRNTLKYAERSRNIKTKVHKNVLEVHYHVLQYHEIIAQLKYKITALQEKLKHCHCSRKQTISQELKSLLSDQIQAQQLLSSLKLNLLQNAIETQKLLSVIHERESTIAMGKLCHHEDWEINGLSGNKDISEAKEELGALERERQKMEEHKLELERQLTELDTQLTKFNENMKRMSSLQHQRHLLTSHQLHNVTLSYELEAKSMAMKEAMNDELIADLHKHSLCAMSLAEKQSALLQEHSVHVPDKLEQELQILKIKSEVLSQKIGRNSRIMSFDQYHEPKLVCHSGQIKASTRGDGIKDDLPKENICLPSIVAPQLSTSLVRTRWADTETQLAHQVPVETVASFPALSPVSQANPKSLPRTFHSLPALIPEIHMSSQVDFSSKMDSLSVPKVLNKQKINDVDVESIKTTSMSSLSTGKSQSLAKESKPSFQNSKKNLRRVQHKNPTKVRGSKAVSTCDSMQSQRPVKFSNAQKRQSHIPSNHSSRLSHGQSKCVLVPHKVVANGSKLHHGPSPYLSLGLGTIKSRKPTSQQK